MLARFTTFTLDGLCSRRITVEVDLRRGLPAFTIVGRGDAAVRESRERVQTALINAGFAFPQRRITVNLAPAHLRKVGPGFDLATACGLLVASGQRRRTSCSAGRCSASWGSVASCGTAAECWRSPRAHATRG